MDSGNDHLGHESIEDDEEFNKVHDNGSCEVENNDKDNLIPSDVKEKGTEILQSVEMRPEASPSTSSTKKGFGLKKWKRIKRDVSKGGDSRVDSGKMVVQELSESVVNPSKRAQVYAERPQKSEGSVSSTNPLVGSSDFFRVLGDSGPSIDAGADSENSEDQSSKSSTAASIPKVKYDKSRMRSLSGKNLTHPMQRGQQGKVRSEAIKKAREEQVKIKEENSRSSMESDSRSSNFVFMQGTYATSNGIRSGGPVQENGDEDKGSEQQVNDGYRKHGPEDGFADSYLKIKTERSDDGSSSNQDPLAESIIALQSAQEALEKEVLKFKEMSCDASNDDLVSDPHPTAEQKVEEMSSMLFPEITKEYALTELEDLFKRKIAAEVEYLTISRTIQNLRESAVDQTLNKHRDTEKEDSTVKTQAGMSKQIYEDVASADEILKIQKRVCKYTSCFFIQLLCFLVIIGVFISQLTSDHVGVVPT